MVVEVAVEIEDEDKDEDEDEEFARLSCQYATASNLHPTSKRLVVTWAQVCNIARSIHPPPNLPIKPLLPKIRSAT